MPGMFNVPADVITVHFGQFTPEHAARIGDAFDAKQIVWWSKEPSFLSSIWQRGVELFVDRAKLEEAQAIAREILQGGASAKP
jgi:hypothetical protein